MGTTKKLKDQTWLLNAADTCAATICDKHSHHIMFHIYIVIANIIIDISVFFILNICLLYCVILLYFIYSFLCYVIYLWSNYEYNINCNMNKVDTNNNNPNS